MLAVLVLAALMVLIVVGWAGANPEIDTHASKAIICPRDAHLEPKDHKRLCLGAARLRHRRHDGAAARLAPTFYLLLGLSRPGGAGRVLLL